MASRPRFNLTFPPITAQRVGADDLIDKGPMVQRPVNRYKSLYDIPTSQFGQAQTIGLGQQIPDPTNPDGVIVVPDAVAFKMDDVGAPQVWTIALSPTWSPSNIVAGGFVNLVAGITFGCGGADQYAEVSVLRGTTLSAPCSGAIVKVRFERPVNDETPDAEIPPNLKVHCSLSPGHDSGRAHRLYFVSSLDPGQTTDAIPIPPFARNVGLIPASEASVSALYAAANRMTFYGGTSIYGVYPGNLFTPNVFNKLAIPGSTAAATFTNNTAQVLDFWVDYDIEIC